MSKVKRNVAIAVSVICVLVGIIVCTVLLVSKVGDEKSNNLDMLNIPIMKERVQNAQYLPDLDNNQASELSANMASDGNSKASSSTDEYDQLIKELGGLDNPYDRNFTIVDMKDEVFTVLNEVGVFDTWVHFDTEELSGTGEYNVSYDEDLEKITVMRSTGFQPWVYDSDSNQFLGNEHINMTDEEAKNLEVSDELKNSKSYASYLANAPIMEEITYRISYYYDSLGREVVECEIASYLFYYGRRQLVSTQYLKNVRDTSFTKSLIYPITSISDPNNPGCWGLDVDSDLPLGASRSFIQLNYSESGAINLFKISQKFATDYYDDSNKYANYELYRKDETSSYEIYGSYSANDAGDDYLSYNERNNLDIDQGYCQWDFNSDEVVLEKASKDLAYSLYQLSDAFDIDRSKVDGYVSNVSIINNSLSDEVAMESFFDELARSIVNEKSWLCVNYVDEIMSSDYAISNPENELGIAQVAEAQIIDSEIVISDNILSVSASMLLKESIVLNKTDSFALAIVAKGAGSKTYILQVGDKVTYNGEGLTLSITGSVDLESFDYVLNDEYEIGLNIVKINDSGNNIASKFTSINYDIDFSPISYEKEIDGMVVEYNIYINDSKLIVKVYNKTSDNLVDII